VPADERVRICTGIARRAVEEAKEATPRASMKKANSCFMTPKPMPSRRRRRHSHKKHEKQLEIDLRDIGHHLEALKRELAPEDQPYAEAAVGHLEKLRTRLLQSMFGKTRMKRILQCALLMTLTFAPRGRWLGGTIRSLPTKLTSCGKLR